MTRSNEVFGPCGEVEILVMVVLLGPNHRSQECIPETVRGLGRHAQNVVTTLLSLHRVTIVDLEFR